MVDMNATEILQTLLNNKPILIVDDEPKVRLLISKFFERAKLDEKCLVFAQDGPEALRKIQNQEFGLIIIDIVLPKKNGLQILKEIKNNTKLKKIPVMIISGNLHGEIVKQAIMIGARHILAKPFNYNVFIERVYKAVSGVA